MPTINLEPAEIPLTVEDPGGLQNLGEFAAGNYSLALSAEVAYDAPLPGAIGLDLDAYVDPNDLVSLENDVDTGMYVRWQPDPNNQQGRQTATITHSSSFTLPTGGRWLMLTRICQARPSNCEITGGTITVTAV